MAPFLASWSQFRCSHANHPRMAGGKRDRLGNWVSSKAAAYPVAVNYGLAQAVHRARLLAI